MHRCFSILMSDLIKPRKRGCWQQIQTRKTEIHWNVKSLKLFMTTLCILIYFMTCNYSLAHFGLVCPKVFSSVCRYENLINWQTTVTSLVGLSWFVNWFFCFVLKKHMEKQLFPKQDCELGHTWDKYGLKWNCSLRR